MATVRETNLPGVGVRHDFVTEEGRDGGVLVHRDGRREVLLYDGADPDRCSAILMLSSNDAHTLNELLGGSRVAEAVAAVQYDIEGLSIDWITVDPSSALVHKSIGDGAFRTRTGASIVAVLRDETPFPAPGPDFVFEAEDVVVAVGTTEGLAAVHRILHP